MSAWHTFGVKLAVKLSNFHVGSRNIGFWPKIVLVAFVGLATLSLDGCEEPKVGPPAREYFLPRTVGRVLEYNMSDGTTHHTKIAKVTKSEDGTTYVETVSWIREEGESSNYRTTYEIPQEQDVVMIRWTSQGRTEKAIVLRGPIAVGTSWPSFFTMIGPTDAKTKTVNIKATGDCRINRIGVNRMLGQDKLTCMEYSCPLESTSLLVVEDGTYCRNVGSFHSKTTIYYLNGRQEPFAHERSLVAIE